jgi:Uma2 family endonuclease
MIRSEDRKPVYPLFQRFHMVEVLSSSTESYDRGNKFKLYRRNPILQEYVLVDAETIAIEIFRKTHDNNWQILDHELGDMVELTSIKLTFPIEQVYEDVVFPEKNSAEDAIDGQR